MAKIDIEKERQRFQAMLENPQSNVERAFKEEHLAKGSYPREWNDDTVSSCNLFYRCFENGYNAAARRQHGSAAQAVASDCRATCDVCFDEVGNEWPCVKEKARARRAAPPVADAAMLLDVLRVVREYPDFDGETPFGQMIDEALAGERPTLLDNMDSIALGRAPVADAARQADIATLRSLARSFNASGIASRADADAIDAIADRMSRRPAAKQPAAEQAKAAHVGWRNEKDGRPPAAGNALTDGDIEEFAERMEASDPKDSFWKEFARLVEQHVCAEPHPAIVAHLERHIDQLKAQLAGAQTACDVAIKERDASLRAAGKDGERYEYLIDCDYRAAKKYLPNLDEAKHKQGLRSKHDAAMQQAASNQQEGA